MKATLIESVGLDSPIEENRSRGLTFIALICAVLITGLLFAGYAYLRKRHAQQTLAVTPATKADLAQTRGPAKAEILVDEALLEGDQTVIGGTVKNISHESLTHLLVDLELKRRKDATTQKVSVQVGPDELVPQQEGHYVLRLRSADYSSVRLVALRSGSDSALLAYTTLPGKKRPPERLEGKTIIVSRPPPSKGTFLNTPDNPVRVP
jgi:hypothetical protein